MTVSSRCIALGLGTSVPVALLFLLSIGLYGHVWIPTDEPGTRPRADLMTLYAASKLAIESPEGMYDQARQGAMQAEVTGLPISGDDPDFLPFAYPAATALALAPLTLLDYVTAYWVLAALNVLALGILVCLLGSRLGLGAEASQVLALSATLCVGVYATLVQGQLSIFVALALSMAVLDLREGREIRAGMWAGLLSLKPVVLPGLLVWLVMRRRWTALVATGSVSALFALVSIGWTGIEGFTAYRALSARMLDDSFYTAQGIQTSNLRGLAHYLGTGDIGWLVLVGALLVVLWFGPTGKPWDDVLLLLALPLLSVHMRMQDIVLLIPAVAIASTLLPMTRWNQRWIVLGFFFAGWARTIHPAPVLPVVLAALVLWMALSNRFSDSRPHG